jgi:hypothetical protein
MILKNIHYTMVLNEENGSIESFDNGTREFILTGGEKRPLFTIRFRDPEGNPVDMTAHDAIETNHRITPTHNRTQVDFVYKSLKGLAVDVTVSVSSINNSPLSDWNLSLEHDTDCYVEWIRFPDVVIPNDLVGNGGESVLLWPGAEGVLVDDLKARENSMWFRYSPEYYPSKGWEGIYPGPVSTQFMAYYDSKGGLYFGAHDEQCNVKAIEYYRYEEGIRLEFKLFPGAIPKGKYQMEYNMVLGVFEGDWYEAANIYRQWYQNSNIEKPVRLFENKEVPQWMDESPVVVGYPVRGKKDTGVMDPNPEYFPFTNAVPYLEKLSDELDSKVMSLLMHWEGTAMWAPPYMWPPFGGEEGFTEYVDKMHAKGNLVGVYSSGIGWTQESTLIPEYNRREDYERLKLRDIMCESPAGELPYSYICAGGIRWGYDMCPANKFTTEISVEQVSQISASGVDYIQYFDQNLGGAPYACYSKNHGHPPAPGKWRNKAMIELIRELNRTVREKGRSTVIGCEVGAAEPFIPYLLFNELRFCATFDLGKPVPVYQYLYHEYLNSFMGNQISSCLVMDVEKSPDNIFMRMAMAFAMGEMFTFVLRGEGMISWDWGTSWDLPAPDQEKVKSFVRHLNAWRKGAGKPFLRFGRMETPYPVKSGQDMVFHYHDGRKLVMPSVLTSRWVSPEGRLAQVFANYTSEKRCVTVSLSGCPAGRVKLYASPDLSDGRSVKLENNELVLEIDPMTAVMIEVI